METPVARLEGGYTFPSNRRNSCYIDSVVVALLFNPTAFVRAHLIDGNWRAAEGSRCHIAGATQVVDKAVRMRIRDTIRSLARGLSQEQGDTDATAEIETLRMLLGKCKFTSDFASSRQQDASDVLYALLELCNLHTGVGRIEYSVVVSGHATGAGKTTTYRSEPASVVTSIHSPLNSTHFARNLCQTTILRPETPYKLGGVHYPVITTKLVYTPDGYFIAHIDRSVYGKRQMSLEEEVRLDGGRVFRLHAVVMHHGVSHSSGHYTCAVRCTDDRWLHYNDLVAGGRHQVVASLEMVRGVRETAVLLFFTETTSAAHGLQRVGDSFGSIE